MASAPATEGGRSGPALLACTRARRAFTPGRGCVRMRRHCVCGCARRRSRSRLYGLKPMAAGLTACSAGQSAVRAAVSTRGGGAACPCGRWRGV